MSGFKQALNEKQCPAYGQKQFGKHPTQKPEELIERIILSSTQKDDIVLDMFNGSGTTGVVCAKNQRNYIGIESSKEYYSLSLKRLKNIGLKNR